MNAWYLLYCKPKSEMRAQQNLTLQNIHTYLPMVKSKKIVRGKEVLVKSPLFPNYIFAKFDPKVISVSKIKATRGVAQLVDCREEMTPLCHLVFALRRQEEKLNMTDSPEAAIENTKQLDDPLSLPTFTAGEKVKFISGPFKDLEGVFEQSSGSQRCQVLMTVLGKIQSTKVPLVQLSQL